GLDPVDALADLAPERVRVLDRALVHGLVALVVDPGAARPLGGYAVDLLGHGALFLPKHPWLPLSARRSARQSPVRLKRRRRHPRPCGACPGPRRLVAEAPVPPGPGIEQPAGGRQLIAVNDAGGPPPRA